MPNYLVKMRVDYAFEIQAENEEEAEKLAWDYDYIEDSACYDGVYDIFVTEDIYNVDESETVGEGKDV